MENTLDITKDRYILAHQLWHQKREFHKTLINNSQLMSEKEFNRIYKRSLNLIALAERKVKEIEGILIFANRLQERYGRGYL